MASNTTSTLPNVSRQDSILADKPRRAVLPIQPNRRRIWEFYKNKQRAVGWEAEECPLARDVEDWNKLTDDERFFLKHTLAFFAVGDDYIIENIMDGFLGRLQGLEVQFNYGYQRQIEQVHSEVYSNLVQTYIQDPKERDELLATTAQLPAVKAKTDWIMKWMGAKDAPFGECLFAFAVVEGVFFSGSFASIYWLRERGLMPGLMLANDLISRDEGLHTDLAVLLNEHLANDERAPAARAHAIIGEAVEVEKAFITKAIPCALVGMNCALLSRYIEFVADRLLVQFGHPKLYHAELPFDFMERISMRAKKNFFECPGVAEYGKANVGLSTEETMFSFTDEF